MRTNRARREALDVALDRLDEGTFAYGDEPGLVEAAGRVRAALHVEVPSQVAARHLEAAVSRVPASIQVARFAAPRRRARALTVGLAATMLLLVSASSAVAASGTALPGDALYPVKRAVERVRIALPGSEASKAQLHLSFADERLAELLELLERRAAGEQVDVGAAMSAYDAELGKAEQDALGALGQGRSDEKFLEHVLARIDRHVARLEFLRDNRVPEQARAAIQRAIDNAEKAKGRVGHGRLGDGPGRGKPEDVPRGPENAPGQQNRG